MLELGTKCTADEDASRSVIRLERGRPRSVTLKRFP